MKLEPVPTVIHERDGPVVTLAIPDKVEETTEHMVCLTIVLRLILPNCLAILPAFVHLAPGSADNVAVPIHHPGSLKFGQRIISTLRYTVVAREIVRSVYRMVGLARVLIAGTLPGTSTYTPSCITFC